MLFFSAFLGTVFVGKKSFFIEILYFIAYTPRAYDVGVIAEPAKILNGLRVGTTKNIEENIVKLVNKYPDTEFVFFYTPYSVLYWESLYRDGWLEIQLEVERMTSEMLLECENVKLYSYFDKIKIMNNIDNFRDK